MTIQLDPFQRVVYLPARYTITPNFVTRNEGEAVIFTVTVYNVVTGTVLTAKLEGVTGSITNSDFTSPTTPVTGTPVTITVDSAVHTYTFTVNIKEDVKTEGTESFRAYLLNNTTRVATSNTVTILDTSISKWTAGPTAGTAVGSQTERAFDVQWNHDGTSVAWAHDNLQTGTAGDCTISVFNRSGSSLTKIASLRSDNLYGEGVAWNPSGTLFACISGGGLSANRGLRVYSRSGDTFTLVYSDSTAQSVTDRLSGSKIRFSPNGTRLAIIIQARVIIYTVSGTTITQQYVNSTYQFGTALAWNPASTRLAIGYTNANFYRIYNTVTNTFIALLPDGINHNGNNNPVKDIAYSPDGTLLIACVYGGYATVPDYVGLVHWSVSGDTYTLQSPVAETGGDPRNGWFGSSDAVAFSPDGTKVILGFDPLNYLDPTSTSGLDTRINIGVFNRSGSTLTWNKTYGGIGGIYGANGDEPVGDGSSLLKAPTIPNTIHWNPAGTSIAVAVGNNAPYFRIYDIT